MKRLLLLFFVLGFIACFSQAQIKPKIYSRWSGRVLICSDSLNLYSGYQWYCGSTDSAFSILPNATKQYYDNGGSGLQGYYYVQVTFKDGSIMNSDTLSIHTQVETASVSPNPVAKSSSLKIETTSADVQMANVQIYSINGIKVLEYNTSDSSATIEAPSVTGYYIVRIRLADGTVTTQKLFVK